MKKSSTNANKSQQADKSQPVGGLTERIYYPIINDFNGGYNNCLRFLHHRIMAKVGSVSYLLDKWEKFPTSTEQSVELAKKWSASFQKRDDFKNFKVIIFFNWHNKIIKIQVKLRENQENQVQPNQDNSEEEIEAEEADNKDQDIDDAQHSQNAQQPEHDTKEEITLIMNNQNMNDVTIQTSANQTNQSIPAIPAIPAIPVIPSEKQNKLIKTIKKGIIESIVNSTNDNKIENIINDFVQQIKQEIKKEIMQEIMDMVIKEINIFKDDFLKELQHITTNTSKLEVKKSDVKKEDKIKSPIVIKEAQIQNSQIQDSAILSIQNPIKSSDMGSKYEYNNARYSASSYGFRGKNFGQNSNFTQHTQHTQHTQAATSKTTFRTSSPYLNALLKLQNDE